MGEYRLCLFDGNSQDARRAARWVSLYSDTDEEAFRHADVWRKGGPAELWDGERLVKVFKPGWTPESPPRESRSEPQADSRNAL
jgi:hypothetical protein